MEQGSGPSMSAGSLAATFAGHAPLDAKAHHQEAWTLDVNAPLDPGAHIGKNRGNKSGDVIACFAISIWMHGSIIMIAVLTTVVASLMPYCMPLPPPAQPLQKVDVKVVELVPPPPPQTFESALLDQAEAGAIGAGRAAGKKKSSKQRIAALKTAEQSGILGLLKSSDEHSALFAADGDVFGGLIGAEAGEAGGFGFGGLGVSGTAGGLVGRGELVRSDDVQGVIRASVPELTACYRAAVERKGDVEGRTVLTIRVGDDGAVTSVRLTPKLEPELDACLLRVIRALSFPKQKATIRYPLVFRQG